MSPERWTRRLLEWRPMQFSKPMGRLKRRWRDQFKEQLGEVWMQTAKSEPRTWKFFMPDFDGLTQNVLASMAVNNAPSQAATLPFRNAVRGRRIGDLISEAISEAYLSVSEPVYRNLNNYNQMYLPTRNIPEMPYANPNLMWLRNRMMIEAQLAQNGVVQGVPYQINPYIFK